MQRAVGRYAVVLSNGETEFVEATKIEVEGDWITLYAGNQPVMTVSSGAVERIEHPEKAKPKAVSY